MANAKNDPVHKCEGSHDEPLTNDEVNADYSAEEKEETA